MDTQQRNSVQSSLSLELKSGIEQVVHNYVDKKTKKISEDILKAIQD
jgi:hypothetical protein